MSKRYLGILVDIKPRGTTISAGELKPLWEQLDNESRWCPISSEPSTLESQFPNRGLVSWVDIPAGMERGSPWEFTLELQTGYDVNIRRRDKFRTEQIQELTEVLDFSGMDIERARKQLTQEGIELPVGRSVQLLVRLCGDLWFQPQGFLPIEGTDRWLLQLDPHEEPLRCCQWSGGEYILEIPEGRQVLAPQRYPPESGHLLDWSSDATLLQRALKDIRAVDKDYCAKHELTKRHIEHLSEVILQHKDLPKLELQQSRMERAQTLLARIGDGMDLIRELSDQLLEIPRVQDEISDLKEAIKNEYHREAKIEVEKELEAETVRLEALRDQIALQERTRDELLRRTDELAARQAELVDRWDEHLNGRLEEIIARPEQMLTDLTILRAAARIFGQKDGWGKMDPLEAAVGPTRHTRPDDRPSLQTIGNLGELQPLIVRALEESDVPSGVGTPLHASFLAGLMPVLMGSRAFEALRAYSACVAAEQLLWIPVTPTMMRPVDLLGEYHGTAAYGSTAGTLIDLLLSAQESDIIHIVVLDGIDRAPVDSLVLPLLACYSDAWREKGGRSLPIGQAAGMNSAALLWPRNVLLAATLSRSSTSLGVPRTLWNFSTLIQCDLLVGQTRSTKHPDEQGSNDSTRCISLSTWAESRATCRRQDLIPITGLWEHLASASDLPREARDACLRFFAAFRSQTQDPVAAVAATIAFCLVAQGFSQPEADIPKVSELPSPYGDLRRALDLASSLVS